MTDKPKTPVGDRHLMAEAMGVSEKPKGAEDVTPDRYDAEVAAQCEEPVLSDEEFATLDTDGDGVVHLQAAQMLHGSLPKGRKAAPENKDAAALRDDKSEPKARKGR